MKALGTRTLSVKSSFITVKRSWEIRLRGFLAAEALIWLSLLAYHSISYYRGFLGSTAQSAVVYLAFIYSLYSLGFYLLASLDKVKQSKALLVATALKKILRGIAQFVKNGPKDYTHPLSQISKTEKRALLFSIVKFYFIPMMLTFLVGNYDSFRGALNGLGPVNQLFTVGNFNNLVYPMFFALFLVIDTGFFAFGYIFESGRLKNSLRSVEPTILGWLVLLLCYPPFNGLVGNYVPWYGNDYASFASPTATFWLRLVALLLMGFYASASVALGPKASNLTNRGIVDYGAYRIVRHPAYISKNLAWWISLLPVLSLPAIGGMLVWSFIYFMRAITEERHLSADPDYVAYCKKVKYRFIPGLI